MNFPSHLRSLRASVALISLIIISFFTLILALGMSEVTISKSFQSLNSTSTKAAYYVAETCLEEALIRLERNADFTGTTLIFVPDVGPACTVTVSGETTKTISIVVTDAHYTEHFQAQITLTQSGTAHNGVLLKWEEVSL